MAWAQALAVIAKAGPKIAKQLPKLWPLLLESKNRERLSEFFVDLANASPAKRLRARIELTAALAEEIATTAENDDERERALAWNRRARNLVRRNNMPIAGQRARREHRRGVKLELQALQAEMNGHLGDTGRV